MSKNDQLKVILDIMGQLTPDDTSFISDVSAIDYVNNLNSNQARIEFKKEFPYTTPGVLEILQDMLQFNPHFRSHASELLQNAVFNNIRNP